MCIVLFKQPNQTLLTHPTSTLTLEAVPQARLIVCFGGIVHQSISSIVLTYLPHRVGKSNISRTATPVGTLREYSNSQFSENSINYLILEESLKIALDKNEKCM